MSKAMLRGTEGYWLTPDGKAIEVMEHFQYVQAYPRKFGFTAGQAKGWTRDDRERVLREAIRRGWIRVRAHRNYITFEVHELTNDALWNITEFLKKTGAWQTVRVQELARGRGFEQDPEYFTSGEALAAARNRPRRRGPQRRGRPRAARPNVAVLPNRGSLFPDGSRFIPVGRPKLAGARPNSSWESWGKTTKATILVGLRAGRTAAGYKKGQKIPERRVYRLVFGVRTDQVGREYGASFVSQLGHYIPEKARKIGTEPKRREPSMQVIVFPGVGENWRTFKRNIRELANEILDWLAQESVIIEYVKDGRIDEVGKLVW